MRRDWAHVDANALAELNAGLINGRQATRIHAHLAECQHCAQVSVGLADVRALLAAVPPPAMPDTVARRLDTAIAAEAAARTPAPSPGAGPARRSVIPRAGRPGGGLPRLPWRRLASPVAVRPVAAAAAVCVLAACGYTLVRLTSPGQPGTAQPGGSGGTAHQHGTGTFAGPFMAPTRAGDAVAAGGAARPAFGVVSSGVNYQRATLGTQVSDELGTVGGSGAKPAAGQRTPHPPTARQDGCVQRITSGVTPSLVDAARYQGHPATIIALARQKNLVAQAWVVGSRCSADASDILAHVWLRPTGG